MRHLAGWQAQCVCFYGCYDEQFCVAIGLMSQLGRHSKAQSWYHIIVFVRVTCVCSIYKVQ